MHKDHSLLFTSFVYSDFNMKWGGILVLFFCISLVYSQNLIEIILIQGLVTRCLPANQFACINSTTQTSANCIDPSAINSVNCIAGLGLSNCSTCVGLPGAEWCQYFLLNTTNNQTFFINDTTQSSFCLIGTQFLTGCPSSEDPEVDVRNITTCPRVQKCTFDVKFWQKHNPSARNPKFRFPWPIPPSTVLCSYTYLEWMTSSHVQADPSYRKLAQLYIAMQLNIAGGFQVTNPMILTTISETQTFLENNCASKNHLSKTQRHEAQQLSSSLYHFIELHECKKHHHDHSDSDDDGDHRGHGGYGYHF